MQINSHYKLESKNIDKKRSFFILFLVFLFSVTIHTTHYQQHKHD